MLAALGGASLWSLGSCGGICDRAATKRALMAECPCAPTDSGGGGDTDGYGSAGIDDEGCGRAGEYRCSCGVDPESDPTEESSGGDLCEAEAPVVLHLSADDSNSMSSPVQVRTAALGGDAITSLAIRPWEFFNYYDFEYPAAEAGQATVFLEMAAEPGADNAYNLQIAVSSSAIDPEARPAVNLTLVLDTSGSMSGAPIERLRDVCRALAARLRAGDIISVVTWDTENSVVLDGHAIAGANDPALVELIAGFDADGSTDLHGGLVAGYEVAAKNAKPGHVSRLVLISDGGANAGITDVELIAAKAGGENEAGIYLVGVGVGTSLGYNDELMDSVTDAGKGAAVFIPTELEAWRMFDDRFVSTLMVAARDVQVELDLPPGFAITRFSGEEYSSDPAEVEPQHLAPNDAMIFHQRVETCAPELLTPETPITVTARYVDAATFEPREVSVTRTLGDLAADPSPRLKKGMALLAYTDALTALRLGQGDAPVIVAEALTALDVADAALPNDAALSEIRAVLEAL